MDIATLLARAAIEDLRYNFSWFFETSAPDKLADLFWDDAVIDTGPWGLMEGQDAIRAAYRQGFSGMPKFTALHAVTNPRTVVNGDTAEGSCYLLDLVFHLPNVNPLVLAAVHEERYAKRGDIWKYTYLKLNYLWSTDAGLVTPDNPIKVPAVAKAAAKANRARAAREAEQHT